MHFKVLIFIHLLYFTNGEERNSSEKISISNISDALISILTIESNDKINQLKGKLKDVNKYVIDNERVNQLIINISKETNLNETNFYKSLHEEDHFRFLTQDIPKSLYLKLKEKVNRDDVMDILSRGGSENVIKSARKAMGTDHFGKDDDEIIQDVVDKIIAESPADDHKFKKIINDSKYWDPQKELEELRDYHQHDGRRIYRGERTTIRYYPFATSIQVMGRFWCGGVIYERDLVLTSAACLQLMHNNRFFRENPRVVQVRIGSNHSRISGELIDALEVYFHPGYDPKSLRNNIAIIRLRRHLKFSYHLIPKAIEISQNGMGIAATAEVLLLGWGFQSKFITSTMFCAGTMTTGEGACDHDAGGPAVLSGKLVGIISFGPTVCGIPNSPTVFTLVGAYADWIETINETMSGYYRGRKRTTTTTPNPMLDLLDAWPEVPGQHAEKEEELLLPMGKKEPSFLPPEEEEKGMQHLQLRTTPDTPWNNFDEE